MPREKNVVENVAIPFASKTPPGVKSVEPWLKSTVPLGMPPPVALTCAVKVTACPKTDGLGAELTAVVVAVSTDCGTAESSPLLVWKFVLPLYVPVMVLLPNASEDVVNVATPPDSVTPPGLRSVAPSVKSTVPVGTPGLPGALTVAVIVTGWPNADGFGEELTTVVVTN